VDLIANEALRRRLGACGAEDVRQYDWETIATRLVDVYRRVQVK
jgi:glycosyltransferase involved in cell wall biosynthesis